MSKRLSLIAAATLICTSAFAQLNNNYIYLGFEVRGDFYKSYINGNTNNAASGFRGKVINLKLEGTLTEKISYTFRHRLNKPQNFASLFDATDFLYLSYETDNWRFSAGKQTYMLGGFEYDLAAIDFYYMSEFSSQFPCYKGAVTATYKTANDEFSFQISNSPFRLYDQDSYSYNFFWKGHHDWFSSTYSFNILESNPGEYIKYIALGNQFTFGRFSGFLDLMSRSPFSSTNIESDFSVICKLNYNFSNKCNVFIKGSVDANNWNANYTFDKAVLPGTRINKIGGGIELWPIKNLGKDLRLHGAVHCSSGVNTNPAGGNTPGEFVFNIGLTWRFRVI